MPASLMDMFTGRAPMEFSPTDPAGGQTDFGGALASRSNSLIGLGLGLLQPSNPLRGQSTWGNALEGFQSGSTADTRQAQLKQQAGRDAYQRGRQTSQDAYQRDQDRLIRDFQERKFAEEQRQFNTSNKGVPPGFARTQDGGLAPIPGGPADPKYLQQTTEAKAKPREMSITDISKLSEEGGKYAQVGGFTDSFEPRFAGYKSSTVGDIANLAGRNLPAGVVGKDVAEGATWWQGYDRYKNVIRNDLYGSALTPSEQAAFEKADITPGMDPEQIKKNLVTQKEVVQNGLKRKANAMIASGYDPKVIAQSYGVDLKELGVTATGRRDPGSPPAAPPADTTTLETDNRALWRQWFCASNGRAIRPRAENWARCEVSKCAPWENYRGRAGTQPPVAEIFWPDAVPTAAPKAPGEDVTAGMALRGIPVLGAYIPQAEAAIRAAAQPLTGVGEPGATWGERYAANLPKRQADYAQAEREQPIASTALQIGGGAAALAPLGATALGARALGATGPMVARIPLGAASGAGIAAADAAARGRGRWHCCRRRRGCGWGPSGGRGCGAPRHHAISGARSRAGGHGSGAGARGCPAYGGTAGRQQGAAVRREHAGGFSRGRRAGDSGGRAQRAAIHPGGVATARTAGR